MNRFPRAMGALLLTAIYTVIVMSPLAPLFLHSSALAQAITGECHGECAACGCFPERSANHSCCCWEKLRHGCAHEQEPTASCCKLKPGGDLPALTSSLPCGGHKQLALWDSEELRPLTRCLISEPLVFQEELSWFYHSSRSDRYNDPPDPPPKISVRS